MGEGGYKWYYSGVRVVGPENDGGLGGIRVRIWVRVSVGRVMVRVRLGNAGVRVRLGEGLG